MRVTGAGFLLIQNIKRLCTVALSTALYYRPGGQMALIILFCHLFLLTSLLIERSARYTKSPPSENPIEM